MRILNSATYGLVLGTALLWVPCSTGAEVDFEAEVKKHMNDPIGCGCSKQDETDLESRIKQVEAAIKEYESQIKEWEAKEKSAKESLFLTNDNRGSVQGSVGFRMSTVRTANARSFAAETDAGCNTMIDPTRPPVCAARSKIMNRCTKKPVMRIRALIRSWIGGTSSVWWTT